MPRQQAYRGGYGGGYQPAFQYDNRQPAAFQYQSFFDPTRAGDFIQSSQQAGAEYDISYTGALAAQDELAQNLVGMQDVAAKNKLLNESISEMNTLVDKHGGDYGRAAKDIAAKVTQVRSNPFWNTAKEADRMRKMAEELKIKYPNAYIFNDPTKKSVVDEEGNLRGYDEFQPDIVPEGDYNKTAREIMSMVKADAGSFGLSPVEARGLEHFLQTGSTEEISEEKIREIASKPEVQQLFLGRHSEIKRAVSELDEVQQRQHGLYGKTAEDFAYEQLVGAGLPMVHRKTDLRYVQDSLAVAGAKRRAALGATAIFGSDVSNRAQPGTEIDQGRWEKMFDTFQERDFVKGTYRTVGGTETGYVMTPDEWGEERKRRNFINEQNILRGQNVRTTLKYERDQVKDNQKFNEVRNLVDNLRKSNTQHRDLTDSELLNAYYLDMDKFKLTQDKLQPIINDDVNEGLTDRFASHMESGQEYVLEGETEVRDLSGKKGIARELNMSPGVMRKWVDKEDVDMGYNYDNGMYYVEMPIWKTEKTDANFEKGVIEGFKKIYFSPNNDTKATSNLIQGVENAVVYGKPFNQQSAVGRTESGNPLVMNLKFGVEGQEEGIAGGRTIGANPEIDEVVEMTVYEYLPDGTMVVATDLYGNPRQKMLSVNGVKSAIKNYQEATIKRNYVKTEFD